MDITASQLHICWQTVLLLKQLVCPNSSFDLLFICFDLANKIVTKTETETPDI